MGWSWLVFLRQGNCQYLLLHTGIFLLENWRHRKTVTRLGWLTYRGESPDPGTNISLQVSRNIVILSWATFSEHKSFLPSFLYCSVWKNNCLVGKCEGLNLQYWKKWKKKNKSKDTNGVFLCYNCWLTLSAGELDLVCAGKNIGEN
jgi:hypothetical protein